MCCNGCNCFQNISKQRKYKPENVWCREYVEITVGARWAGQVHARRWQLARPKPVLPDGVGSVLDEADTQPAAIAFAIFTACPRLHLVIS